jgi:tRNA nucleotidyltransferase/poly(A) polymerase
MNEIQHQVEIFRSLIPSELLLVIKTLHKHGKDAYIIGGAVRDFLFDEKVKDFDLATDAEPNEIVQWLSEESIKTKPIGGKFGTVLAIINKMAFDISTYRQEEFYEYGKPPKVTFVTSLDEDLIRRDFLMNSLIYDPMNERFIDKLGGMNDITSKTINMIGDPFIRLKEDGLRIIRLARFISKFNLKISPELYAAVQSIGDAVKFRSTRVLQLEIFKFLNTLNITEGLKLLFQENIVHEIFPKFPFLSPSEEPSIPDRVLEEFSKIKVENNLTRLFGILLILSDRIKLSVSDFKYISDDLGLVTRQRLHFERLFHSWKSFPENWEENTIRRWVRATGINSSKVLVHILFLIYELEFPNSKSKLKKTYLDAVQNAVNRLKSGDQS